LCVDGGLAALVARIIADDMFQSHRLIWSAGGIERSPSATNIGDQPTQLADRRQYAGCVSVALSDNRSSGWCGGKLELVHGWGRLNMNPK
jgi:hypothetical protein